MPPLSPAISGMAPQGASPLTQKIAGQGSGAGGVAMVREAIDRLEQALTQLPLGSDIHKAVSESITKLAKVAPAAEGSPGIQMSALRNLLARQNQAQQARSFLNAAQGPQTAAGGMGGPPGGPESPAAQGA